MLLRFVCALLCLLSLFNNATQAQKTGADLFQGMKWRNGSGHSVPAAQWARLAFPAGQTSFI
jgi:hypothetical protein